LQRYYITTCQLPRALEISWELYRLWQRFTDIDPAWKAIVHNSVGVTSLMIGDFETALYFQQKALEYSDVCYRETQILVFGTDMGITSRCFLAIAQWCSGYPDQARNTILEARARAEQFSHSFSIAMANNNLLFILKFLDDIEVVRNQAAINYAFAVEHHLPSFEYFSQLWQAWSIAKQDRSPAAMTQIEQTIMASECTGLRHMGGFFRSLLAEAYQATGKIADAIRGIDVAMDYTNRFGEEFVRAEMYRLKGEFLLQQANSDAAGAAEACFRQSLDVARKQNAKSWELRTATSLARLWCDQGKYQGARELLEPVYDWFTEGFETPDLKNARTLLDEEA
jgi:predicted ATPase